MDALDEFILEAELIHGWRATAVHEVQRDQPNRCRTYHAKDADGQFGFVKVLPPSTENLDLMRLHLGEFNSEREIVELCGQRNTPQWVLLLSWPIFSNIRKLRSI